MSYEPEMTMTAATATNAMVPPKRKGTFLIYGPPGRWKSTETHMAAQDSIVIASEDGLDQFYMNWSLKQPAVIAAGKKPPIKTIIIDKYSVNKAPVKFDRNGEPVPTALKETFESAVIDITRALSADLEAGRPPRWRNIIVDECSIFWDRFLIETIREMMTGRTMTGENCAKNAHGPAHHGAVQTWTREVIDRFRTVNSMGANLFLLFHDQEPTSATAISAAKLGGPMLPNQRCSKIFAAAAHLSLLSMLEDSASGLDIGGGAEKFKDPRHVWQVPTEQLTKVRGITVTRLHELRYEPLEVIIKECGYTL